MVGEILDVLSPDTSFTIVAVAWFINTDKAEGDSISSLEVCPAPLTLARQVSASTLGMMANVSD